MSDDTIESRSQASFPKTTWTSLNSVGFFKQTFLNEGGKKNIKQTSINFVVICYSTTTSFDCVNKCYVSIGTMRLDNFTV